MQDRVKKISEHIRSKTRGPVQDQILLLGSKTLKPQGSLLSYGINKEKTVHLSLKVVRPSHEGLPLSLVESGNEGQRHLLQMCRSTSVARVKEVIKSVTRVAPDTQIVTCIGKRREDGKLVADYNIRKGTVLTLPDRILHGG